MLDAMRQEAQQVITSVVALIPGLFGAIILLLIGWLLASFLKMLVSRITHSINHFLRGRLLGTRWEIIRIPSGTQALLGQIIFWVTMLVFIAIAVRLAGFSGAAAWLDRLVVYLPSLFSGGLIIVGGFILGTVMRTLITHAAAASHISQPQRLGQLVQVSVIVVALIIGLGQIGIDVTFIIILFGIIVAAVMAGFSLAFGLGARTLVENLIANQHAKQLIKPGQLARIGTQRGRVLEFTATGIILECEQGRIVIPARLCLEQSFELIADPLPTGNETSIINDSEGDLSEI
jgi:hypothetical protein